MSSYGKKMFLAILAKIRSFSDDIGMHVYANSRLTSVQLVRVFEFSIFLQKLFVCTSCRLYFIISIDLDRNNFFTSEIDFRVKTQQLDFLKNQFAARLRHLRST